MYRGNFTGRKQIGRHFLFAKNTKVPEPVFLSKSPGTCRPDGIYTIMIGILFHTIPIGLLFSKK